MILYSNILVRVERYLNDEGVGKFMKGVINSAMIYSAQSPKHEKIGGLLVGEEQNCSLPYPNCFTRYPGGYLDLVMWHNLCISLNSMINLRRIQWKGDLNS